MLSNFYRILANTLYFIPYQIQRFKAKEPNAVILAAGATKARKQAQEGDVRYEAGWITARRAALILTTEKLVCGSWEIPLAAVNHATLMRIQSLLAKAYVLKISTTDGSHYQFGLQYDPAWELQTALKLDIQDGKIKYSTFSIIYRVIFLVVLLGICGCYSWYIFSAIAFTNSR